jgi:hypothetical protein
MLVDNDINTLSKVRKNNKNNCETNLQTSAVLDRFHDSMFRQNVLNNEKVCQSVSKVSESVLKVKKYEEY